MNCAISAQNLRTFVKSIACLQKFGDDVCLSAASDELFLSAVSATRSAFARIRLDRAFFQRYEVTGPAVGGSNNRNASVKVQFAAKALLAVLKPRTVSSSVESCSISLQEEKEGVECRIVVTLHCRHGVVKTHRLNYANATSLFPLASRDTCTSTCLVSPTALQDWTDHFWTGRATGMDEITFWCSESFCKLRNYENAEFDATREKGKGKGMSTTLSVDIDDFDEYNVASEQLITFSLKEFKSIIAFADVLPSQVDMAFSQGGEPVLFDLKSEVVSAEYVIATTADDPAAIKAEADVKPVRNPTPAVNGRKATPLERFLTPPVPPNPARSQSPAVSLLPRAETPLFREESTVPDSQLEGEFDDMGDVDEEELQRVELAATQGNTLASQSGGWNLHED